MIRPQHDTEPRLSTCCDSGQLPPEWRNVDRLERTVVQLVEAGRYRTSMMFPTGDWRCFYFDNAAETLLDRRAKEALIEAEAYSNALEDLAEIDADRD